MAHGEDLVASRRSLHGPVTRHDELRVELGERLERERALVQARMRERQPRLVDRDALHQQQVEVDRPRPVARPRRASGRARARPRAARRGAPAGRSEVSIATARVEEPRLVEIADGIGLAKRRDGDDLDPGRSPSSSSARASVARPVAEVRPEPHVGTPHNPTLNTSYIRGPAQARTTQAMRALPARRVRRSRRRSRGVSGRRRHAPRRLDARRAAPAARCTEARARDRRGWGARRADARALPSSRTRRAPGRADPSRARRSSLQRAEPAAPARSPSRTSPTRSSRREWWRAAVGIDTLTPPGPGQARSPIVDRGVDVTHRSSSAGRTP